MELEEKKGEFSVNVERVIGGGGRGVAEVETKCAGLACWLFLLVGEGRN